MKSYLPLLLLAAIFSFTIWLRKRSKRLNTQFWSQADDAGFGRPADLPADLQKTRSYLTARQGSPPRQWEGALLLVGSVAGAVVPLANGVSVVTRNFLIGFLLPARGALKGGDLASFRQSHPLTAALETLSDGSQLFLWAYTIVPSNLAKVLSALQDALKYCPVESPAILPSAPVTELATEPAEFPVDSAQAVTERDALKGARLKRFFAAGSYGSKDPAIKTHVKGIFSCEREPTSDDFDRAFLQEAKEGFAWIKHAEVEPGHMTCHKLHELPHVPLPTEEDRRPLLHWKITAGMDCPDIKRGYSLSGVFGWPEKPPAEVVSKMVMLLAVDSIVCGDNNPEDAEYSYIADVSVTATRDALTHP